MVTLDISADLVRRIKLYAHQKQEPVERLLTRLLDNEAFSDVALRELVEAAPGAILLIDATGKIVLTNERVEMMFGYSQCDLVGQPVEMLLPERYRSKHEVLRADFGTQPKFLPLGMGRDLVAMRKGGVEFPVEIGLSYAPTQEGLLIMAFVADITERKRVEDTLRENAERYRVISNLMSDYAAAYRYLSDDTDQAQLEWVIGAFEQITGHSLENATQTFSLSQPVIAEDLPIFQERHRRLRAGQPDVSEYRIRDGQGNLRWVRSHGFPEWDEEQQKVVRVHVGVRDVTERRRAEETYVTLVQNSLQGLAIFQAGRIVFANGRFCEMFGCTLEELCAETNLLETYVHPESYVLATTEIARVFREKGTSDHQYRIRAKDGTERWLQVLSTWVSYQGMPAIQAVTVDVTEQRKASEAAAHAAAIIRSSDDAIISKTLAGTIVSWNPGAERLVGYAAAEAIGQPISLFMSPEQLQEMASVLSHIQAGKMVEHREAIWKHKEGRLLHVSLTISPIKNSQGQTTGVSVIARDMTERLQAASALKESEARLKQAMNVAHLGVWDWNVATDNTVWAGEIFRMYGITPEEFTGKGNDYLDFTLPEDRAKQRGNIEKAFARGITEKMLANLESQEATLSYQPNDFRILRRDGTLCHVQGDAISIVDDDGHPQRMIGVLQDVTEQKLVEEELRLYRDQLERLVTERTAELEAITHQLRHEIAERREAQEALLAEKQHTEMILNHVADGVMSTDVQGNILYVNPAWEQLTGYTSAEAQGRNPRFLQSGYTKRSNYKAMWETILAGDVWTGLFINQRKDHTHFDTLETIVPVKNAQGDITQFVAVWRDVTKEQKLAVMKEEFIANAAHDLSNPITVLHTTLYLLKRDPAQLKQRLTLFEDQIALLQTLVDDLLTVSRLDRRLMPPTFKQIDLNTLVDRVLVPQTMLASTKGLTLVCMNSLAEPLLIYGDSDLLTRVFVNLIANAVNYTPYAGTISVATHQEGAFAVFVVEDTGIGISANDIPHIFDRFYRSDGARKTGQGTGLGLAIVKEIVELHQGRIEVESVPNEGTSFRVFLPIETHLVG